jgi:hypothetical protein
MSAPRPLRPSRPQLEPQVQLSLTLAHCARVVDEGNNGGVVGLTVVTGAVVTMVVVLLLIVDSDEQFCMGATAQLPAVGRHLPPIESRHKMRHVE